MTELSEILGVSEVTTRKDLQELEEASLLKRVHGGAVAAHRSKYNLSLEDKVGQHATNKRRIAEVALGLVHDGDTLILDAGSTALALACGICTRIWPFWALPGRRSSRDFRPRTLAETKAAMVASAAACGALLDHSKLGRASLASFVSWADLDCLVTDAPLPPTFHDLLARDNVTYLVANRA